MRLVSGSGPCCINRECTPFRGPAPDPRTPRRGPGRPRNVGVCTDVPAHRGSRRCGRSPVYLRTGSPQMSVFDTIRIAASGLTAERFRMDVAAGNLANSRSTRSTTGTMYQPVAPVFEALTMSPDGAQGVAAVGVARIGGDPIRVYDPTHPDADAQGFVSYPDVDAGAQMT